MILNDNIIHKYYSLNTCALFSTKIASFFCLDVPGCRRRQNLHQEGFVFPKVARTRFTPGYRRLSYLKNDFRTFYESYRNATASYLYETSDSNQFYKIKAFSCKFQLE